MNKILAICGVDLAHGFGLSGIEVVAVNGPREALEAFVEARNGREYALIIIDATLRWEPHHPRERIDERALPLVVWVPGRMQWEPDTTGGEDDYIAQLIRRAVGYQLDLKL